MTCSDSLHQLERHLLDANILHAALFAKHGAHQSYMLILEGGPGVLAKPEDEIGDGGVMVGREVAAWIVARDLGWSSMLAATVLRRVPSFVGNGMARASLQVLWPDNRPDADPSAFDALETLRAGVFDAMIGQTDRSGHNWLAVPANGRSQLKLVDHGYAFKEDITAPPSTFFDRHRGEALPNDVLHAIELFLLRLPGSAIPQMLTAPAQQALVPRSRQLVAGAKLEIN